MASALVVAGRAVGAVFARSREPAENVAAAADEADLDAQAVQELHLFGEIFEHGGIERVAGLMVLQRFAADFENDAAVLRRIGCGCGFLTFNHEG